MSDMMPQEAMSPLPARPTVATIATVFKDGHVLLVRRANPPDALGKLLKPLPSVSFWKKPEYMQPRNVSSQPSMPSITMNTVCCVITTF